MSRKDFKTPHSIKEVSYSECDKFDEILPNNRSIRALSPMLYQIC